MNRKILFILICLVLLSLSGVSASNINQTNIDEMDNSLLSTSNDVIVDKISASGNLDDNLMNDDEYVDVNEAYNCLNSFRTEDNVWQWNEDDATKTYFNTNDDNKLEPLAWDTALEETAKIRAKELSQSFSHTRPDGNNCFTIFPNNLLAMGENIAMGTSLTGEGATQLWKETNDMYAGQGHRRNMLNANFNCVGIAGFEKDGIVYWVQDFGYNPNVINDENVTPTSPTELPDDNNLIIYAPNITKYYNGTEKFVVTLKNEDNKTLSNETVSITINGKSYTRTTNSNGEASMAINLNYGVYPVTTEYNGQKIDSKVTVISTIQGKDITKIFRNDTQYYATFLDNKGNFLKNKDVAFNINGVFYTRTTNDKGVAKLNINLGQGDYIITAKNPVTGEQRSNIVKVLPSIIENNNITKYYKNDTQYVVKVLNLDGSVAGAGVNVTFKINGVFYTRTTNASGYAKLNINLAPDEYTITAEYNTLRVSNKIKVLPVLSAEDLIMSYMDGSKFEAKLLDGQGKAYASQPIQFNINGVFYDITTDAKGIARLNINLMSGKYIITSMYNGATISNEVTIR